MIAISVHTKRCNVRTWSVHTTVGRPERLTLSLFLNIFISAGWSPLREGWGGGGGGVRGGGGKHEIRLLITRRVSMHGLGRPCSAATPPIALLDPPQYKRCFDLQISYWLPIGLHPALRHIITKAANHFTGQWDSYTCFVIAVLALCLLGN